MLGLMYSATHVLDREVSPSAGVGAVTGAVNEGRATPCSPSDTCRLHASQVPFDEPSPASSGSPIQ
jgi:hypothetical protein